MENIVDSLKHQRQQLLEGQSDDVLSRHTSLIEIAVISLYNRLANRLAPSREQFRSSGAIMALGALGRGLIGPEETIELLFIKADPFPWRDGWMDEVVRPLRQAGWKVAAEQHSADEIVELAGADRDIVFKLLDARYISGNRELVDLLDGKYQAFLERHREELLKGLCAAQDERRRRMKDPGNWLEPSLTQTPGGLEDIRAVRAGCRILLEIRCLEDAIFQGYLLRQEVDWLQRAEKMYLKVLSLLQMLSGDDSGILRFEQQLLVAEKLGYDERSGMRPVEHFMRELCGCFTRVHRVSLEFRERLRDSGRVRTAASPEPEKELEPGVVLLGDRIGVRPAAYPATAVSLVHLFVLAGRHGARLNSGARQWIQHHGNLMEAVAGDERVRDEFLQLLLVDSPNLPLVRMFYDYGFLGTLLPELAAVHCLVQHDAFHVYPVHEHHFRTLGELKRLMAGRYRAEEPELSRIAERLSRPQLLCLAALVHDVGKSAGENHARCGADMIPSMARRLGLSADDTELLRRLVDRHLLLMDNASMRDLADQEMVSQCAQQVGSLEGLNLLLLLSFADMKATGPKAFRKWRETPVLPLYRQVRYLLEKGEPSSEAVGERLERIKERVREQVRDLMDREALDTHFSEMAPRYLFSMSPQQIAHHLRLEVALTATEKPFIWEVEESDGGIKILFLSWETPGLFAKVAGILTLHELDITGAQVFTKKNGCVLFIFQCRPYGSTADLPDWEQVKMSVRQVMQGQLALDYRIALRALQRDGRERGRFHPRSASRVLIDNESSQVYTILEVYTTDRVGLLYAITRTLMDLALRVYVAKITTKVDQAADIFYLKTATGSKMEDPVQIEEIRNALLFRLDGPKAVDRLINRGGGAG